MIETKTAELTTQVLPNNKEKRVMLTVSRRRNPAPKKKKWALNRLQLSLFVFRTAHVENNSTNNKIMI
jgi:hypothetical protein